MIRRPLAAAKTLYEKGWYLFIRKAFMLILRTVPSRSRVDSHSPSNVLSPGDKTYSYLHNEDETTPFGDSYELNTLNDGVQSPAKPKRVNQNVRKVGEDGSNTAGSHFRSNASVRMWNSIWLNPFVLMGFTILFAAMFVATLLLYHFSEIHHGLSTQISTNRYSWTYGPTARKTFYDLAIAPACD